jgi:predicted nucleotidyltransferase
MLMKPKPLNSLSQTYYVMASESKEGNLLMLILENSPLRQWHFEELVKQSKLSRSVANKWLKKYCKQGLLNKIKEKNRFPYFTAGSNNQAYQSRKRIYALEQLEQSGLISHLASLPRAKAVILFGSFSSYDWQKDSDIDLFIYGSDKEFEQGKYELRLKREIQVHKASNEKELRKIDKLLPYIISGDFIKGSIQDLGVEIHAKA